MSGDKFGKDRFGARRIQPCQVQNACQTASWRYQAGGSLVESRGPTNLGEPVFGCPVKLQDWRDRCERREAQDGPGH